MVSVADVSSGGKLRIVPLQVGLTPTIAMYLEIKLLLHGKPRIST